MASGTERTLCSTGQRRPATSNQQLKELINTSSRHYSFGDRVGHTVIGICLAFCAIAWFYALFSVGGQKAKSRSEKALMKMKLSGEASWHEIDFKTQSGAARWKFPLRPPKSLQVPERIRGPGEADTEESEDLIEPPILPQHR